TRRHARRSAAGRGRVAQQRGRPRHRDLIDGLDLERDGLRRRALRMERRGRNERQRRDATKNANGLHGLPRGWLRVAVGYSPRATRWLNGVVQPLTRANAARDPGKMGRAELQYAERRITFA